jgi:hypothetical protein
MWPHGRPSGLVNTHFLPSAKTGNSGFAGSSLSKNWMALTSVANAPCLANSNPRSMIRCRVDNGK